jgi:hypothetical protein
MSEPPEMERNWETALNNVIARMTNKEDVRELYRIRRAMRQQAEWIAELRRELNRRP